MDSFKSWDLTLNDDNRNKGIIYSQEFIVSNSGATFQWRWCSYLDQDHQTPMILVLLKGSSC